MDKEPERDSIGRFLAAGNEPINHRISFKLNKSLKLELEKAASDRMGAWLREAVIEKLNREKA